MLQRLIEDENIKQSKAWYTVSTSLQGISETSSCCSCPCRSGS